MSLYPSPAEMEEVSLLDVVDTALEKGVVLQGDAMISVADVDLVFLGLRLVLASVDTAQPGGGSSRAGGARETDRALSIGNGPGAARGDRAALDVPLKRSRQQPSSPWGPGPAAVRSHTAGRARRPASEADKVEQGLAKLVLSVVELLRQLLERQALRRMARGSLSDEEIERMGTTFQRLEGKMKELKRVFGVKGDELNLSLGPLGNLM